MAAMLAWVGPLAAVAQYPGQVTTASKDQPILRSIGVLEWTGEAGKPKTSRLIPVAIFDGQTLQDGGIYLARPMPLAVSGGVEYELRQNGKNVGLYELRSAGQQQGVWVGFGAWKALPKPKAPVIAKVDMSSTDDEDRPTLHRKYHGGDSSKSGKKSSAPAPDPDRPTLNKKSSNDSASTSDGDRPTLHQKDNADARVDNNASAPSPDPDRPVLHKVKEESKPVTMVGHVTSLPNVTDPDRPRLLRGKPQAEESDLIPDLVGIPEQMHQMVAVSDARNRPEHIWTYSWSNPADELRLKGELEDIAREALGLKLQAAPMEKPKTARTHKERTAAKKAAAPPPASPQLADEDFHVFELAYGSGATMVLSARTEGALADQKFVTLIAQPDLYGNVRVLMKSVTDGRHLDDTPRMRLVDAVDALSDNRGELLFELRGRSQRQFALYRVYRGQAEKLFVTGGETYGMSPAE